MVIKPEYEEDDRLSTALKVIYKEIN